jgi:hypothetical protein
MTTTTRSRGPVLGALLLALVLRLGPAGSAATADDTTKPHHGFFASYHHALGLTDAEVRGWARHRATCPRPRLQQPLL